MTDIPFTVLAASVLLAMMVTYGVWLVVWGRRLLMRPEPTPGFAARWERHFTKRGVLGATTPADARSQLVFNWMRNCGRQNVILGVASLVAAGAALLGLVVLRDLLPKVSPFALFIPTSGPWFLALLISIGKNPPFDVAHGEQGHPLLDRHKPWRLLLVVPALCALLSLAYISLLALRGLGVLTPDQPPYYPGEVTVSSFVWVLWVAPILMLLAAGLSGYFIVQTARQRTIYLSGDPDVDRRAASKLREYQNFRLEVAPGMLVFLGVLAETFLMPLHSSGVTDGIVRGLMLAGFFVVLGAFLSASIAFEGWSTSTLTQGDSSPTPDTAP